MSTQVYKTASFGGSKTGLATVGYQLFNSDGTTNGIRITAGVHEIGFGCYGALIALLDNFRGRITWDVSVGGVSATEELNPILDQVIIESGITPSTDLTNDANTQLTAINARQSLALILSAAAAVIGGAATIQLNIKPTGKPSAADRILADVDADGNRLGVRLKVPN